MSQGFDIWWDRYRDEFKIPNGENVLAEAFLRPWGFETGSWFRITNVNGVSESDMIGTPRPIITYPIPKIYTRVSDSWVVTNDSEIALKVIEDTPVEDRIEKFPIEKIYTRTNNEWVITGESESIRSFITDTYPANERSSALVSFSYTRIDNEWTETNGSDLIQSIVRAIPISRRATASQVNTIIFDSDDFDNESNRIKGDLQMKNGSNVLLYWSGSRWKDISTAFTNPLEQEYINIIADYRDQNQTIDPLFGAIGGLKIYFQEDEPSSTDDGDLWHNEIPNSTQTIRVEAQYSSPQSNVTLAYFQDEAPDTASTDDLWIDTNCFTRQTLHSLHESAYTGEILTFPLPVTFELSPGNNRLAHFQVEAPDTAINDDLWMDIDDIVGEIKFHGFEPFESIAHEDGYGNNQYRKRSIASLGNLSRVQLFFNVHNITDVSPLSFGNEFGGVDGHGHGDHYPYVYFFPARPVFSNEMKIEVYASEDHAEQNITSHVYNIIF